MPDCVFCKIIKGEIPSEKVYEDEYTFAFLDNGPDSRGHTLVIPKDHLENLYGIPDEEACRWIMSIKKVAIGLKHALDADGINLLMNNEMGQIVPHAHMHLIPRYHDDTGFHFGRKITYKEGEKTEIAEKIKKELGE